jgi:hypothetical protein
LAAIQLSIEAESNTMLPPSGGKAASTVPDRLLFPFHK